MVSVICKEICEICRERDGIEREKEREGERK